MFYVTHPNQPLDSILRLMLLRLYQYAITNLKEDMEAESITDQSRQRYPSSITLLAQLCAIRETFPPSLL